MKIGFFANLQLRVIGKQMFSRVNYKVKGVRDGKKWSAAGIIFSDTEKAATEWIKDIEDSEGDCTLCSLSKVSESVIVRSAEY
jgi:hypothetical protein